MMMMVIVMMMGPGVREVAVVVVLWPGMRGQRAFDVSWCFWGFRFLMRMIRKRTRRLEFFFWIETGLVRGTFRGW
jgi:hypothetical protein